MWNLQTGKHHLKFFWRCKSHVSPRWFSKQNWVENRMRLIFYSIAKFIQFIRSSLYCTLCLCCHDNALAAFVTRAKERQNCCWCSLKSSKYANEINIPSEYELTDGKNLLVNNDNSNSKETKLNVRNLSHKKTNRKPPFVNGSAAKFEEKKLLLFCKKFTYFGDC